MRYAIFSDVHGNYTALNAVLERIDSKENVDQLVCLGDIIGYKGKNQKKCLETILDNDILSAIGNHEAALSDEELLFSFRQEAISPLLKITNTLPKKLKNKIKELPYVIQNEHFVASHGTLPKPNHFYYTFNTDINEFYQVMQERYNCNLCFNGHSHQAELIEINEEKIVYFDKERIDYMKGVRLLKKRMTSIINVGSVGCPRDGDIRASYVVYDSKRHWVKFRRVEYEPEKEMSDSSINIIKKSVYKALKKTFPI